MAQQISQDELLKQIAALKAQNTDLSNRLGSVAAVPVRAALPEHLQPEYEVLEPGIYADDTFYPAGIVIRDVTGKFIPNDCLAPRNQAAEARVQSWLSSLPAGRTPPLDAIIQAAMEMRPKEGEDEMSHAEFAAALVKRAKLNFQKQTGQPFDDHAPLAMPQVNKDVPMMSNTKVHGGPAGRPSSRKLESKGAPVGRQPAPPMGTMPVRNQIA